MIIKLWDADLQEVLQQTMTTGEFILEDVSQGAYRITAQDEGDEVIYEKYFDPYYPEEIETIGDYKLEYAESRNLEPFLVSVEEDALVSVPELLITPRLEITDARISPVSSEEANYEITVSWNFIPSMAEYRLFMLTMVGEHLHDIDNFK